MDQQRTPSPKRRWAWIASGVGLGLLLILGGRPLWIAFQLRSQAEWRERTATAADTALARSDLSEADRLANELLKREPNNGAALLIAARVAAERFEWSAAYSHCDRMSEAEQRSAARQLYRTGEAAVRGGRARQAEACLQLALHLNPRDLESMHILAFVLGAEARAWEALPLVRILVEQHRYGPPQLLLTGATDQFYINHRQFVEQSLTTLPEDPLPRLALARTALINEDLLTAEAELKRVLARDPVPMEAHARWGRLLFDQQRLSELRAWQQALPVEADAHPEIWITRGLYALQQRQESAAIRCFGTAALLDPNHLTAHLYLGRLLPRAGQPELAREFQQRAELLSELLTPLTTFRNNVDPTLVRRVADLCERLGRPREALAWAEWMLRTSAEAGWAADLVTRFHQQFPEGPVWILDESRLARRLELVKLPLPDWKESHTRSSSEDRPEQGLTRLQWTNEAAALGIHFQYHNDAASTENTLRMPEFTGGGLAVLDFDVDGWPDLYAAQGASLSTASRAPVLLDRLFRQQAEGRFIDATGSSGIRETGYSQGVTVGDFDQDGFPDLYVANFGPNRLYRNNGDGTFTDVTETAGLNDRDWTTSCVMADLNNDGWPEIVAVNYLTGADIATRVCGTASHPKACLPT